MVTVLKKYLIKSFDSDKTYNSSLLNIIVFIGLIMIVLIAYSAFGFVNMVLKSLNWLVHVSKAIMLCTIILGCLLSIIAVYNVALSVMMVNGCEFFEKAQQDSQLISTFKLGATIEKLMDTCLYQNSTGDLVNILSDTNSQGFQETLRLIRSLTFYNNSNQF